MTWESDPETPSGGRDWSKLLWAVVAVAAVAMLIVLYMPQNDPTTKSQVRVWHILIPGEFGDASGSDAALSQMLGLRQRILDGEKFAALAREYSTDEGSSARGGDLGWVSHGELADPIDEYIWTAPLDEVSDVIQTQHGFHLVLVTDREIAEAEKYEQRLHERVLEENYIVNEP